MQKRILIVDDEPAIRDMVAFALRKGEFEPAHAGDAREAQSAIADRVPDLILLDWMLPGTSGLELARRWRREELTREVPIIMLTARGERIDGAAHRVFAGDTAVTIGPTEYRLLHFFMTHAERVYSRAQLLDHVWGGSVYVEERTVDVHIRRLRKTLEPFELDGMVQTVRGAGYRFSASM